MFQTAQGIPNLPDLTHPQELVRFGSQLLTVVLILAVLLGLLGVTIALLNFSLRQQPESSLLVQAWLQRYSTLLRIFQQGTLVLILLIGGFFLCSTLGNRYHHWEQARVAQVAASVAGDRLEQNAPQVRYVIEEPYTYDTQVEGRIVRVKATRPVNRFLTLAGSQIQVNLNQARNPQDDRAIYRSDFAADYQVVNRLNQAEDFFFEIAPPAGYSLLQSFKVERDGARLQAVNPGDYGFPLRLEPGASTRFRVTYQAQGGPRWVYNANGQLLSNFRLTTNANFPNADFASGIVPTETKAVGQGTTFTWVFDDNVSVLNPFGVFTATSRIRNTGVIPRLLLVAPAVLLWWLLLLYLSLPLSGRNVAIAGGIFFACLLSLTYLSRIMDASLAWAGLSLILLGLAWGLGYHRSASLAAVICTISGVVLPVFGLLIPYSGLTLSLAGLLSVVWLAVRNWYGLYLPSNNRLAEH